MTTFMDEHSNLISKIFANFDRPFKEIDQYKFYRKDDKGYLLVVNALGLDKESLDVNLEYQSVEFYDMIHGRNYYKKVPVVTVVGKKKNQFTGQEYSINLGLGLDIAEKIEGLYYDCSNGVCVINIKVKSDSKPKFKADNLPDDFRW